MRSGPDALETLAELKPLFHPDPASVDGALENQFTSGPREVDGAGGASYAIGREVLKFLAELPPSPGTSVETGCGHSTVVLANVFATHISVNPDLTSNRLVGEFVESHFGVSGLRHVATSSDQGLPRLVDEGCRVDLALIDGNHSHPFPLLDFHYMDQMLSRDGLLLIDNTEIHAVQELTLYLEFESAYQFEQLIGNCAVYRKVSDRKFGWKSQTIRPPSADVDAVRRELTHLRMEIMPELRASLTGASPLPGWPHEGEVIDTEMPRRATHAGPTSRSGMRNLLRLPTRRHIRALVRWYATPSGALAGAALFLLAVGVAAPGLWRLLAVAGVVLLAIFLPYRFLREQRRTDRRIAELRTELFRQVRTNVDAASRRLESELTRLTWASSSKDRPPRV